MLDKLNEWLQVLGLFGVMAGLLFIGLQLRQEQQIAMSDAYQERTAIAIEVYLSNSENSILLSAQSKQTTSEQLTPIESLALSNYARVRLLGYENIHYQYVNGFITDEHWERSKSVFRNALKEETVRNLYESNKERWRASFREVLDELVVARN